MFLLFNHFMVVSFLCFFGNLFLQIVQFISKTCVGCGVSCTVYKGRCTLWGCEVVQFIRDVVQFPRDFIILLNECNTRHTNKKESVTTSLNLVQLSLIKPYKGVQFIVQKLYKIDTHKMEVINIAL